MITSLMEMLELPILGHMTHVINFFVDVINRNYDVITVISNLLLFQERLE